LAITVWKYGYNPDGLCLLALATLAFFIPLWKPIVPVLIVFTSVILIYRAAREKRHPRGLLIAGVTAAIFILHVIGLPSFHATELGWNELGIKSSLLVFPFLTLLMPDLSLDQRDTILKSFVAGCLAFIPIAIGAALYRVSLNGDWTELTYQQLGLIFHPTYAATYQTLALVILMLHANRGIYLLNSKWLHYISVVLIVFFISLLASKAGFIASVMASLIIGWSFYFNLKSKTLAIALVVGMTALQIGSALLIPVSSGRIENALITEQRDDSPETLPGAHASSALRMVTWRSSFELMLDHPFGVGTGRVSEALTDQYVQQGEVYAASKKLNAHNQFLQFGAELGWIGAILLVVLLCIQLGEAIIKADLNYLFFILVCGMNFLFESFLEVQAGVVFFCFFTMIFNCWTRRKGAIVSQG
jgi:O-antigen ligase